MTAVDLDALDKLRGFCTCAGITPPHGPLCNAPIVADLIAEARKYRALREDVEGLAETFDRPVTGITFDGIPQRALFGGGDVCYRLRAVVATVDGEQ